MTWFQPPEMWNHRILKALSNTSTAPWLDVGVKAEPDLCTGRTRWV